MSQPLYTADNKLLKEIKARIARLHRWTKDEAAKPKSSQPTLLQLWETQQAMRDKPASRYESIRKLREQAALYNLLAANGITTMQQFSMKSGCHERNNIINCEVKLYPLNVECNAGRTTGHV